MFFTIHLEQKVPVQKMDDGYVCTIDNIKYQALSLEQLKEMVSRTYAIVDHDKIEQKHHNYVFHPSKFSVI